jgi:hypothetical protein
VCLCPAAPIPRYPVPLAPAAVLCGDYVCDCDCECVQCGAVRCGAVRCGAVRSPGKEGEIPTFWARCVSCWCDAASGDLVPAIEAVPMRPTESQSPRRIPGVSGAVKCGQVVRTR